MQSPRSKGVLISQPRGTFTQSNSVWVVLFSCVFLVLYVCAYVFTGQKSTNVSSRSVLLVIPGRSRGEVETRGGGQETWTETTGMVASTKDEEDEEIDEKDEETDENEVGEEDEQAAEKRDGQASKTTGAGVAKAPKAPAAAKPAGATATLDNEAYEDVSADDLLGDIVDYEDARGHKYEPVKRNGGEEGLKLRPRTDDDREYVRVRRLNPGLNPHVSTELKMKDGWVDTPFDELVAMRLENDKCVLSFVTRTVHRVLHSLGHCLAHTRTRSCTHALAHALTRRRLRDLCLCSPGFICTRPGKIRACWNPGSSTWRAG